MANKYYLFKGNGKYWEKTGVNIFQNILKGPCVKLFFLRLPFCLFNLANLVIYGQTLLNLTGNACKRVDELIDKPN